MASRPVWLPLVLAGVIAGSSHAHAPPPDTSAPAGGACTRGVPEPQLAASAPTFRSHSFKRTGALESVERAVLGDGVAIEIRQSGCAHFGLTVVFDATDRRAGETSLQAAQRLMQRWVQAAPEFAFGRSFAAVSAPHTEQAAPEPIEPEPIEPEPLEIVETPGYSSYYVETREENGRPLLLVTYSVVL